MSKVPSVKTLLDDPLGILLSNRAARYAMRNKPSWIKTCPKIGVITRRTDMEKSMGNLWEILGWVEPWDHETCEISIFYI